MEDECVMMYLWGFERERENECVCVEVYMCLYCTPIFQFSGTTYLVPTLIGHFIRNTIGLPLTGYCGDGFLLESLRDQPLCVCCIVFCTFSPVSLCSLVTTSCHHYLHERSLAILHIDL